LIGIDPYYTFNTKDKEETLEYRVPIGRLLQEQKEEARLLPGLARTDESVFNVPGLGKNYLKANIHPDLKARQKGFSRLRCIQIHFLFLIKWLYSDADQFIVNVPQPYLLCIFQLQQRILPGVSLFKDFFSAGCIHEVEAGFVDGHGIG
jgi:hypothetical protein